MLGAKSEQQMQAPRRNQYINLIKSKAWIHDLGGQKDGFVGHRRDPAIFGETLGSKLLTRVWIDLNGKGLLSRTIHWQFTYNLEE